MGGVFFVALIEFSLSVQPGREAEAREAEDAARELDPHAEDP
ncbi:MAG: hypothetical protein ACQEXJ_07970 [Myxococcota bacterium]